MRRSLPVDRLIKLDSFTHGLTAGQITSQRALFGPNEVIAAPGSTWGTLFADTLRDPMLWFLAMTAFLYLLIGQQLEATVLALALLPIIGMDAFLHWRTRASTDALRQGVVASIQVIRDGRQQKIPFEMLVPADLIIVLENQLIPADSIILDCNNLQIDESALTGEAMPVRKASLPEIPVGNVETPLEESHWAFAGTRVLTGHATLQAVFTGEQTYYGEILRSVHSDSHELTPLQKAIGRLTRNLLVVAAGFCIALAAARLLQGHGLVDALISALTLAVAALPEEFAVVFAFFLGVGVFRLARQKALVKRAVVVENIGRVSCICSDKTGTLTEGRLRLANIEPASGTRDDHLLRVAASASRIESGDPMDLAILQASPPLGQAKLATFPFTEDRRREVSVLKASADTVVCCAKGAPETIFGMSDISLAERELWQARIAELARTGRKVLAFCEKSLPALTWQEQEPTAGYQFTGLLAFEDPVREGVIEAVTSSRAAGIRVIMVTGDHPETARAVAREIGLGSPSQPGVVHGEALDAMLEQQDAQALAQVDVIARAMPAQKLRLVESLQRAGHIVAVTGDGVNDVPALKGADVGIAMSARGTQAAREVAPILLMDDNFRTIVRAIAEGRQLYANLKLSFAYLLMIHIPLVISAAVIPFAGLPLLYLPVHIVWLELMIHPTALLVFQQSAATETALGSNPVGDSGFFTTKQWWVILAVGILVTGAVVFGYVSSLGDTQNIEHARMMALATLIAAGAGITLGLSSSGTLRSALIAVSAVLGSIILAQIPAVGLVLSVTPLHKDEWVLVAITGVVAGLLCTLLPRAGGRPAGISLRPRHNQ